jgi:hypothetical protein
MKAWLAGLLLLAAEPALACKCSVTSRDHAIAAAPLVFEGRILSIQTNGTAQVTTIVVTKPIKGVSMGVRLKVKSHTQSAACGYDFREANKTLTVGGEKAERNTISVRRCTMYNLNH